VEKALHAINPQSLSLRALQFKNSGEKSKKEEIRQRHLEPQNLI
jgi:hypothetical protein